MPALPFAAVRRGSPRWAAALAAVLLLSACADPPSPGVSSGGTDSSSPATGGLQEAPCPEPIVSITSPVPGAQMHPGPFAVVGTVTGAERTLKWSVEDVGGGQVGSGYVYSGANGQRGSFTVPLDLAVGSYEVTVRDGGGSGYLPTSRCLITQTALDVVSADVGPSWNSGASGGGVTDGAFASWRGSDLGLAGTWVDRDGGQVALWSLRPGAEYGAWTGDLEVAVGAIQNGETWAAAAQGAYDSRWRQSLRSMARLWAGRPGQLYIRFAHEFNGDWYPWSVTSASRADFVTAWQRFRALQQEEFPASALVFAPNSETAVASDLDWRTAFPGVENVDVLSMSYFNGYPWTDTPESFQEVALRYDHVGAPRGIQRHLEFARSVGLPFAVSEWSNNAAFGDSSSFMQQMDQFFRANAGPGPGRILYEILFNVADSQNPFAMWPRTNAPTAAEAYRNLW